MKILAHKKFILGLLLLAIFFILRASGLTEYLSLSAIQNNLESFQQSVAANFILSVTTYFGVYVVVTAFSLPGAAVMTLAGGALFGLGTGIVIVSFASTLGATLSFLASRLLFKESVEKKFGKTLSGIQEGVRKDGAFYLLTLRLIPAFPFFMVNLVMGLTPIKLSTYFFTSQLGMLPGTIAYVNAGLQLGKLRSLSDVLSAELIGSFVLLGLIPLFAKFSINKIKLNRLTKKYRRPKTFDYNVVVIGGGAAGLVSAYISAAVKSKVLLIEKSKMGGDCLNYGCVPSKAILKSAKVANLSKNSEIYGVENTKTKVDFEKVMKRVHRIIKSIEPHDSIERYQSLGVECEQGHAHIISPWEIEVNRKKVSTRNIIIATGAAPILPDIVTDKAKLPAGLEPLVSDNLWNIRSLPKKLMIVGAGPIGCEMALAFSRLGSEVVVVDRGNRPLKKEDPPVSEIVKSFLEKAGVRFVFGESLERLAKNENKDSELPFVAITDRASTIEFERILFSVGRKARVAGFGLEELGIEIRPNGTIKTNDFLQTKYPNIYACGDVTGPFQLTHAAAHQAWYCAVNALFGRFKKFRADYSALPWVTFTDPEVATVGLTEQMAKEKNLEFEITTYEIEDLDRAIAEDEAYGIVRVITKKDSDKILGATIVGSNAGELISEYTLAIRKNLGLNEILSTIHAYPTFAEANKYAAGVWKKNHAPEGVLKWIEKYHSWQRS